MEELGTKVVLRKLATAYRALHRILKQFYLAISKRRNCLLLLVFVLLYGGGFSYLTLVRYYTFNATGWDLGVFSQSFYTTLNNGAFFYNNLEIGSHFHVHFSPILILLLPFYAISQHPETLLVLQAFAIGLGAIPLYSIAKQELGKGEYGLVLATLYLLYPPLHGSNLFDFHPDAFTPLFVFSAVYFFKNEKWASYFVFMMLSLFIKEDITLVILGVGLYGLAANAKVFLQKKINKCITVSFLTVCVSIAWLFFAFYSVSYFVKLDGYGSLWNAGYSHHTENVYDSLGGSGGLLGVISSLTSNPLNIVSQLQYLPSEKFVFVAFLFLPLCMVPFLDFSSIWLFLPVLSEFMLASNPNYFAVVYHYPLHLVPVLFVATVYGLKKLSTKISHVSARHTITRQVLSLMLISTLVTWFFIFPFLVRDTDVVISEESQERLALISLIPLDANTRVLTQNDYFPQVSSSRYAYAYWNTTPVDYILIDVSSFWFDYQDLAPDEYVARYGEPKLPFADKVMQYVNDGEFGLLGQANSLLLYKKGFRDNLSYYRPYSASFDWKKLFTHAITTKDTTAISKMVILHKAVNLRDSFFWYGPYMWLPPGTFEVKFRLKIANATDKYVITLDATQDFGNRSLVNYSLFGSDFSGVGVWQYFTLQFQLDKLTRNVEFRGVNVSNATDVYLDYISVTQTEGYDNSASRYTSYSEVFNWQRLQSLGVLAYDPFSVSDKVLLHKAVNLRDSFFWYGPYLLLPSGKYEVKFRLKIANATDKYVITLDAAQDFANRSLANYVLFGDDFSGVGVWQYFTLQFQLDKPTRNVEFRGVNVSNATDVYLDYISVKLIVLS